MGGMELLLLLLLLFRCCDGDAVESCSTYVTHDACLCCTWMRDVGNCVLHDGVVCEFGKGDGCVQFFA